MGPLVAPYGQPQVPNAFNQTGTPAAPPVVASAGRAAPIPIPRYTPQSSGFAQPMNQFGQAQPNAFGPSPWQGPEQDTPSPQAPPFSLLSPEARAFAYPQQAQPQTQAAPAPRFLYPPLHSAKCRICSTDESIRPNSAQRFRRTALFQFSPCSGSAELSRPANGAGREVCKHSEGDRSAGLRADEAPARSDIP